MEGLKTNSQKWDLQPPPYTSLADMGPSHIPRIGCIPISFYRSPLCPKNPVLCPKDFRGFPPTKIQGDVFRPSKSYGRPVGGSQILVWASMFFFSVSTAWYESTKSNSDGWLHVNVPPRSLASKSKSGKPHTETR